MLMRMMVAVKGAFQEAEDLEEFVFSE